MFCPQKTYCSAYFNIGVSFQLTFHFLLILHTNSCHYLNETAAAGSRVTKLSSAQALVLFYNVVIHKGTSVTYFLNALNKNISDIT